MSFAFDPQKGLIIVNVKVSGPKGDAVLRLALDTGATSTLINATRLQAIGYDTDHSPDKVNITTGSGIALAPRISVAEISALERTRAQFSLLAHTLPASIGVDGLLGLDFLRGCVLNLDFSKGMIHLA